MYRIDDWINEGSGWIVESIESQYINISTYIQISGSFYLKLPAKLRSPKKGLIKIKNEDQKCFLWCHVRHTNPIKIHPERITKEDMDLLHVIDGDRSHYVYIKDFDRFMFYKTKHKNKKYFYKSCF